MITFFIDNRAKVLFTAPGGFLSGGSDKQLDFGKESFNVNSL
jgi:hypothetical protein